MTRFFFFQRSCSWVFRHLTRIRVKWFKNAFISIFAKLYKINWDESKHSSPRDFEHFNAFFTRELKEGARTISNASIVSPSDGKIAAFGKLEGTQFINAKGHDFTLEALIADPHLASEFENGAYATVYLSPRDYHRIHMPIDGKLLKTTHIPGRLYSVSIKTAEKIPTLFAENERLVCLFETALGRVIVILVGAINVSSMETVWAGEVTPPYGKTLNYRDWSTENITLKQGEELGRFNMGSTVIVITERDDFEFTDNIGDLATIALGNPLLNQKAK